MPKVGRSQSTISSTSNDGTQLGEKKKSRWVSPPLLPSFIRLIFILPVEFHGSSHGKSLGAAYSKKGLAGAARRAKARGKSQGMRSRICPDRAPALFEPLALHQCKGSPQKGSKMPFPKHSLLLQPLLTVHFQGKKGNKIGNRG